MADQTFQNVVNGELVAAASGATYDVEDPTTGEVYAAAPWWDAAVAMGSVAAQILLAQRRIENWLVWIAVDVLAIGLYWSRDLHLTAGLYGLFLVMCIFGWFEWRRAEAAPGIAPA